MSNNNILLLCAVCFLMETAFAQWPADTANNIKVCQSANDQKYPEAASDGEGGAIIVWQDERAEFGNPKIYAQRIDSSGITRWAANGVLISNADDSQYPKIVSDGAGGAIITWFDLRNGWPNSFIAAQRVNGNGDTLWKANGVTLSDTANSWAYPSITGYNGDGAVVTWIGVNGQIFAQKVDMAGNVQWSPGGVLLGPEGGVPQITTDNSGGAIVTWFDYDLDHRYTHIFAQRVNSAGTVMWLSTGDTICYAPNYQHKPECVPDGNGGAIICWLDGRADTSNYPYAQRVDAGGNTYWTHDGAQISTVKGYYNVRIASDGAGGAFLVWLGGGYSENLFIQRINGGGVPQWPEALQLTDVIDPSIPRIISDGVTGVFVIWENPAYNQVKVQHIASDGTLSFPAGGKTISMGNGLNGFFAGVTDGKGKIIVTWEDTPAYNVNICAHRTDVSGFITGISNEREMKTTPNIFALNQNFPNPFNPATTITFTLAENSDVSLKVFDILGRGAAELVNAHLTAGTVHYATLDGSRLSSGIYFYRLEAGKNAQVKKLILIK